jgi:hypothetical protein
MELSARGLLQFVHCACIGLSITRGDQLEREQAPVAELDLRDWVKT